MLKGWTSDFFLLQENKSIETYFSAVPRMYVDSRITFSFNHTFLYKVSVFKDNFKFKYYKNDKY